MKLLVLFMQQYRCCGLFIFTTLLVIGCNPTESLSVQQETHQMVQIATATSPLIQGSIIATDMPSPTSPIINELLTTPSATPTNILPVTTRISPFETPTTAPLATLTAIEADLVFENFMATNGGCLFPCWWGIQLGDNLQSISQTFINLGMPWLVVGNSSKVDSEQMGTLNASYYSRQGEFVVARLSVHIQFHELDGSVEYIYVFANRVRFAESEQEFIRDWEQYFLSSFLQRYGQPTQVYFRLRDVADVMDPPQFSVSLLYREQGLAITYHIIGKWLYEEDIRAGFCLDLKNVQAIELSLFNPEGFDRWGYQFAPYHDELYEPLTWEAQFGMSLDTFYETYQHPENLTCLSFDLN